MKDLQIRRLEASDAAALERLLTTDPADYRRHFVPFDTTATPLAAVLGAASLDRYWGIVANDDLVGFMMLRGLDAGYQTPSFGVYVAQRVSRNGVAAFALAFAEAWCRLNGCDSLMLSVHADNVAARHIYEAAGFRSTGETSSKGHAIYRKRLSAS